MKEKNVKFSKRAIKGACWILKCFVPENPIQGLVQDALDECAEKISNNMTKNENVLDILEDEALEKLMIPESQYEIVRQGVKNILENTAIDEIMLEENEYEFEQVVNCLWNRFSDKDEYSSEEQYNIKKVLRQMIKKTLELLLENTDFLIILLSKIQKLNNSLDKGKQETYELQEKVHDLEKIVGNRAKISGVEPAGKEIKYQKNWKTALFLNRHSPQLCLRDLYQIPEYYLNSDYKNSNNNLNEILDELIKEKTNSEMLLVLGKPGSGKSSLVTYILNEYAEKCKKKFLVFPFSTLKNVEWNVNNTKISEQILTAIGISDIKQLNEYVLILDGFDEISTSSNRENIINQLYEDWVENIRNVDFSIIITCRENYLQRLGVLRCRFITLCLLSEKQIEDFCRIYWEKVNSNKYSVDYIEKLCTLRDIVGIPLILYMIVALDVNIVGATNICDVYDKIFCLNDGIYDRCEYNAMGHPLTSPLKREIHDATKKISIKMWTDNPEEAFILQRDYEKIISEEDDRNRELKNIVLIGQYFQYVKYCEGASCIIQI